LTAAWVVVLARLSLIFEHLEDFQPPVVHFGPSKKSFFD
jgi:hypothetical protein